MIRPGLMLLLMINAAPASARNLSFLACPQLHDTSPNCWTAIYEGETYFIGAQRGPNDSYLPQMKHQVLVEGVVTDEPRICGGLVMKPLRVSVMPELDLSCDGPVLSGEGLTPPVLPARRPLASRPRDVVGGIGSFMRSEPPSPPYGVREFRIEFDYGTDILVDQMQKRVVEILIYATVSEARRISITGYSATSLLSNGTLLAEAEALGEQRARKIGAILSNLGLTEPKIELAWVESEEAPNGIDDAQRRRVTVVVTPSGE